MPPCKGGGPRTAVLYSAAAPGTCVDLIQNDGRYTLATPKNSKKENGQLRNRLVAKSLSILDLSFRITAQLKLANMVPPNNFNQLSILGRYWKKNSVKYRQHLQELKQKTSGGPSANASSNRRS